MVYGVYDAQTFFCHWRHTKKYIKYIVEAFPILEVILAAYISIVTWCSLKTIQLEEFTETDKALWAKALFFVIFFFGLCRHYTAMHCYAVDTSSLPDGKRERWDLAEKISLNKSSEVVRHYSR